MKMGGERERERERERHTQNGTDASHVANTIFLALTDLHPFATLLHMS